MIISNNIFFTKNLFLLTTVFLIASCSGSNSSEPNTGTAETNQGATEVFSQGGSCSEVDNYDDAVGPTVPDRDSPGYFECNAPLINNLRGPGSPPTGTGVLSFVDTSISIDGAAVELFQDDIFENHKGIQLYLHDGDIRSTDQRYESSDSDLGIKRHKVDWGIYSASFVLSVELASATAEQFEVGTFEFMATDNPNDSAFTGMNTMFRGVVFYDTNSSGGIDSLGEIIDVTGGNITITGERPNWSISADVSLSNGETMMGQFDGDYIDVPTADASSL